MKYIIMGLFSLLAVTTQAQVRGIVKDNTGEPVPGANVFWVNTGHGDRICIGDGNFPGRATAQQGGCVFLRADGHGVPELLDAILQVMPLDAYVETPVMLMERMKCDLDMELPIWTRYEQIVVAHDERGAQAFGAYERFEFYRQAQRCFCIIQTSEQSQYAYK